MKKRVAQYVESFCESGFACLITMVQGDVPSLSLTHWLVASETGLIAGAIAGTTVVAARFRRPWLISLVLGGVTVGADVIVHRANFGVASFVEALLTGAGAFALSLATTSVMGAIGAATRRRHSARMQRGASG